MMRAATLRTRSLVPEAACFAACGVVAAYGAVTLAFAQWWGLIIKDVFLVPTLIVMVGDVACGVAVAQRNGEFRWAAVAKGMWNKLITLILIGVAFGFQRAEVALDEDTWRVWGHWYFAYVMVCEAKSIAELQRKDGKSLGPIGWIIDAWEAASRSVKQQLKINDAANNAASYEREAAKQELRESGEIKSSPAFDVIDDHSNRMTD